jgi:hypothetical protein
MSQSLMNRSLNLVPPALKLLDWAGARETHERLCLPDIELVTSGVQTQFPVISSQDQKHVLAFFFSFYI